MCFAERVRKCGSESTTRCVPRPAHHLFLSHCLSSPLALKQDMAVTFGWLVGWLFWVYPPLETVFQSNRAAFQRGRKKREKIDERQNVQTNPHLALLLFKLVGRPGTESLPSTVAPPDHPMAVTIFVRCMCIR